MEQQGEGGCEGGEGMHVIKAGSCRSKGVDGREDVRQGRSARALWV